MRSRTVPDCLHEILIISRPEIPDDWDDDLKDLMVRFLDKNPMERIRMLQIRVSQPSTPADRQISHGQSHPWTTSEGSNEMISKDDNLYYIGQQVEEPTQEELGLAIRPLKGIL